MARIRSIHPNTPTDPDFALIPIEGRLLFIYSWTIADDAGNLEHSPRGLKMALFPGDQKMTTARIGKLVDLLIAGRFYEPYEVDGRCYLHVRSFAEYQKPDHPTAPRFPLFPGQVYTFHVKEDKSWILRTVDSSNSTNAPRTLHERTGSVLAGREGKGTEGKGTETANDALPVGALVPPRAAVKSEGPESAIPPEIVEWGERVAGLASSKQSHLGIDPNDETEGAANRND